MILGISIGSIFGFLFQFNWTNLILHKIKMNISFEFFLAILFLLIHSLSFASNSFTVFEDIVTVGLLQTHGFYNLFKSFNTNMNKNLNNEKKQEQKKLQQRMLFFTIGLILLTRIASYSRICREEQFPN